MRKHALAAAMMLAALASGGCRMPLIGGLASDDGPGVGCDTCARTEAQPMHDAWPYPYAPDAAASSSASATGGQRSASQPIQSDPTRITPLTTWNRGAGANTATNTVNDTRSQSGAPSVNQSLIADAVAGASSQAESAGACGSGGGYISPAVVQIERTLDELREQLRLAATPEERAPIREEIRHYLDRLVTASADTRKTVEITYHMEGQRVIQVVANGSKSGDPSGSAIDPEAATAIANAMSGAAQLNQGAPSVAPLDLPPPEPPVASMSAPLRVEPAAGVTFLGDDGRPIADYRPVGDRLQMGGGS